MVLVLHWKWIQESNSSQMLKGDIFTSICLSNVTDKIQEQKTLGQQPNFVNP